MVRQSQNLVGHMQSCFRPMHGMVPDISIKPRSEYQWYWPDSIIETYYYWGSLHTSWTVPQTSLPSSKHPAASLEWAGLVVVLVSTVSHLRVWMMCVVGSRLWPATAELAFMFCHIVRQNTVGVTQREIYSKIVQWPTVIASSVTVSIIMVITASS